MSDRSSPRSKTVLVYSYDHAALQVIRDFLGPLGFTVEVAPAPEVNSVEIRCESVVYGTG